MECINSRFRDSRLNGSISRSKVFAIVVDSRSKSHLFYLYYQANQRFGHFAVPMASADWEMGVFLLIIN